MDGGIIVDPPKTPLTSVKLDFLSLDNGSYGVNRVIVYEVKLYAGALEYPNPKLTSEISNGYKATAQYTTAYDNGVRRPYRAFDGNGGSYWDTYQSPNDPNWLQLDKTSGGFPNIEDISNIDIVFYGGYQAKSVDVYFNGLFQKTYVNYPSPATSISISF